MSASNTPTRNVPSPPANSLPECPLAPAPLGAPWAARRHNFAAADFAVVRLEDLQAVARLKADLVAVYRPVNSQELFAIERIALAQQALLRAARLESGLFTACLNEALDPTGSPIVPMTEALVGDLEITRAQNRNFALAEGFRRLVREGNTWTLLLRYQAQAERHYRRAVEEFERLKALRGELPNKPIFEGQPEETAPPSAPPETNLTEPADAAPVAAGTSPRDPDAKPERQSPGGLRPTGAHAAAVRVNGPLRAQPVGVRRSTPPAIPAGLAGIGAGQHACDPGAVSLDRDLRLAGVADCPRNCGTGARGPYP